jgi:hypothetical protein
METAEEMDLVRPLAGYWLVKATTQPLFLWVKRFFFLWLSSCMHRGNPASYQHSGSKPDFLFLWFWKPEYRSHEIPPSGPNRTHSCVIDCVVSSDLPGYTSIPHKSFNLPIQRGLVSLLCGKFPKGKCVQVSSVFCRYLHDVLLSKKCSLLKQSERASSSHEDQSKVKRNGDQNPTATRQQPHKRTTALEQPI